MGSTENPRLALEGDWSIGEEAFAVVVDLICQRQPDLRTLVEFGSGPSSIRWAQAFPDASIVAIEGDRPCFENTQRLAEEFLQPDRLYLRYQPLIFQTYGPGEILSYRKDETFWVQHIDCAIVDGPPFYTLRGREACLYQVYPQLAVGGLVILDDYGRNSEKAIVQNWLSVYPDSFAVEILDVGHQLAVLQKLKSVEPQWDSLVKVKDSAIAQAGYAQIKTALSQVQDSDLQQLLAASGQSGPEMAGIFHVIQAMREAYGISAPASSNANPRTPTELQQLQLSFQACLELLEMKIN